MDSAEGVAAPALPAALTSEEEEWLLARFGRVERARVPSEEAAVWRLEGAAGVWWLKAHLHANKADREAGVYERLSALGAAVPFERPRLLGRPSPRALLLSDLGGAPLTAEDLGDPSLLGDLGVTLGAWHALPFEDHDALAPVKALARRWRGLLEALEGDAGGAAMSAQRLWGLARLADLSPADLSPADLSPADLSRAQGLAEALREALGALRVGLERLERDAGRAWWRPLAARHLCHRDVRPQNLRLMWQGADAGAGAVEGAKFGLLDFGQARPDLWCADWVTLYSALRARRLEGGAAPDWRAAWGSYCAARPLEGERAEEAARLLRVSACAHALGTASWALRHADAQVARRAEVELLALIRALEPDP